MKENKKIAVLLSSYNGEKYIKCQIDSIMHQRLDDDLELHLFIRDDGSTDNTINILKEYEKNYDKISVFYENNIGYIKSFFRLIFIMQNSEDIYDYYSLSDQDDRWDCDKLKIAISRVENQKGVYLYESTTRIVDENLTYKKIDQLQTREITFYNSAIQTFSAGHTYVFNRELLMRINNELNLDLIFAHDAFIHNLAVICGNIYFDNTPHNDYRQHSKNLVGATKNKSKINWIKLRLKRISNGESKKYASQIKYYLEVYKNDLSNDEYDELYNFFLCQKNFFSRVKYISKTKFYRQTIFETIMFKLLYIFGGYDS